MTEREFVVVWLKSKVIDFKKKGKGKGKGKGKEGGKKRTRIKEMKDFSSGAEAVVRMSHSLLW